MPVNRQDVGNKGEWSELYVLLKLLADGKIYAADEHLHKLNNIYLPILKIFRSDGDKNLIYNLPEGKDKIVELYINGDRIESIKRSDIAQMAYNTYKGIVEGSDKASFVIPDGRNAMRYLHCTTLKAASSDKTDIKMKIHDPQTGYDSNAGFSIKSRLGGPSTLLNAGKTTNFIYNVAGISDNDMKRINSIEGRTKLIDRMNEVFRLGTVKYDTMGSKVFEGNLQMIDSMMDEIIASLLLIHYKTQKADLTELATNLEKTDPIGYKRDGIYRFKIKKLLAAVALGMVPGTEWDGRDESNGGYIIVREDGEVLTYLIYNRDSFETYLLNNTYLERASSTRHEYCSLYKKDGEMKINLNLQIRFR